MKLLFRLMPLRLLLSLGLLLGTYSLSRAQFQGQLNRTIYGIVQKRPEFPGGADSLRAYLNREVVVPAEAKQQRIEGWVVVSFMVWADGSRSHVTVARGLGFGCDEEAIRVVNAMPKWLPGEQDGRPVNVKTQISVPFGVSN